jgi:tetratricopeptide (TPR) repeat protein
MESEFNDEPRFNRLAAEPVAEGSYAEAEALLEAAVQSVPTGWKAEQNDGRHLTVAFWDQEEFLAYVRNHPHPEQSIFWVDKSYSRAWYLQAVAASKQGQYERALFCVDCGLELEPDHP